MPLLRPPASVMPAVAVAGGLFVLAAALAAAAPGASRAPSATTSERQAWVTPSASTPPTAASEGPIVSAFTSPTAFVTAPAAATPGNGSAQTVIPGPTAGAAQPTPAAASPLAGCGVFPRSNAWNQEVAWLPVAANSALLVSAIGLGAHLHPDFSATGYGIPINVVGPATPRVTVAFEYADESDAGPYPIAATR